ncbi:response regulator [Ferruginibacter paludis]|uniref:response regulator transcription factor n=1 Tax=Ferruginibacter paludis TaxID=1310417 RepID=UPI0025B2B3D2|nr:response regulator [Ferruginibacter paludis]MDN3654036.1 response regulator [Ferruginibacter paludis]
MTTILIVDDEPDLLRMVSIALSLENFETLTAATKNQAVAILHHAIPDLIILDVNLSGHDGRDFCKELKSNTAFKHIPVLLYSADQQKLADFELCNADAVLAKPFDIWQLTATVKRLAIKVRLT